MCALRIRSITWLRCEASEAGSALNYDIGKQKCGPGNRPIDRELHKTRERVSLSMRPMSCSFVCVCVCFVFVGSGYVVLLEL